MAFSTPKTLTQLITLCRNVLMDPNGRVWSDAVLTQYINDWQADVQSELELVWTTSTSTTSATSFVLSDFGSNIQRLDAVYWNGKRLVPRNREHLFQLSPTWVSSTAIDPTTIVPVDNNTFEIYPEPTEFPATIETEYVKQLVLSTGTATCELPTWSVYSCPWYVAARAYGKDGPLNDLGKSRIYKAYYTKAIYKLKDLWSHRTPLKYPVFKPASTYQSDILQAQR